MMKVTLLLVSCLAYLAAGQSFGFNNANTASCNTGSGCSLSSILDANALINIVSAALGGSFNLDLSTLTAGAVVNIDATGVFSAGQQLYATAVTTGATTVNIASGVTLNAGSFAVQSTSNTVVNGNIAITNAASNATSVTVAATATLTVSAGAAINAGSSTVQASGNTTVSGVITAGTYTQNSAYLVLNAAASTVVVAASTININGAISGNGAIGSNTAAGATATVYVSGTVSIGNSPGTVTINGDWRPSATATYQFEAANAASYDHLIVSGKAYFNGFCRCTALNNYVPDTNQHFNSITASGTDGSFISTTGTQSGFISKWSTSITANAGIINFGSGVTVVVSSVFLVACVLASLL